MLKQQSLIGIEVILNTVSGFYVDNDNLHFLREIRLKQVEALYTPPLHTHSGEIIREIGYESVKN